MGGNFGYGLHPATQRPATLDKNVLSQCEALIVMGIAHSVDRKTVAEWIQAKDIGDRVDVMFAELGSLEPGEAWLWWPGEDRFERFKFRARETLHPRDMQKLGLRPGAVELGDASAFVERLKKDLARTVVHVHGDMPKNPKTRTALLKAAELAVDAPPAHRPINEPCAIKPHVVEALERDLQAARVEISTLNQQLGRESELRRDAERRLATVRRHLQPYYTMLAGLFAEIGEASPAGGAVEGVWAEWAAKAPNDRVKRMLEVLVQKKRLKKRQLATLSRVGYGNGTWFRDLKWFTKNSLVTDDRDEIALVELT
jgi:hypothetical protein